MNASLASGTEPVTQPAPIAADPDVNKNNDAIEPGNGASESIFETAEYYNNMIFERWINFRQIAVDDPCANTCQALSELEAQLENCGQIFLWDRDGRDGIEGRDSSNAFSSSASQPKKCEYCHVEVCDVSCSKPKLFFLKKKPPFSTASGWDEKDEYHKEDIEKYHKVLKGLESKDEENDNIWGMSFMSSNK
mmetsp:Transcript_15705/g.31304  ORF Transcript_15705/g.31304 Transcript_15705/m.31304 type:complete len:192 (+) Transcript_15705:173-748(+)